MKKRKVEHRDSGRIFSEVKTMSYRCRARNTKVADRTTNSAFEIHYNTEKSTNMPKNTSQKELNVDVKECRPRRKAAAFAEMRASVFNTGN